MSDKHSSKIIIALAIIIVILVCIVQHLNKEKHAKDAVIENLSSEAVQDNMDIIDTTEILLDKKLFVCIGDIDLDISDIGVVSFNCLTEEKKVHIVSNPQELFVTQYLVK